MEANIPSLAAGRGAAGITTAAESEEAVTVLYQVHAVVRIPNTDRQLLRDGFTTDIAF